MPLQTDSLMGNPEYQSHQTENNLHKKYPSIGNHSNTSHQSYKSKERSQKGSEKNINLADKNRVKSHNLFKLSAVVEDDQEI